MSEHHRPVHAWEIWANPILKRYCRSRLRKKHLIPWGLIVLIATLFIVFLLFTVSKRAPDYEWSDGARLALVPLVILQMFLLMLLGTGAVAAGIARESIDGMIDYQRLTPMTPLAKIVGYLFGLPVREYVLTAITLPFVLYCGYQGGILLEPAIKFYGVFLCAVILYHLTGLVAGSVVKRKFLAGRTAQFLIVLLYLVLPRFAALGFIFLVYLTVLPAWSEQALPFVGSDRIDRILPGVGGNVPWFNWEFSPTAFSLIIQGALIVVLVVILARKWRDPEAHIFGHEFSIVVFSGVLALVLGNALPLIADGSFFNEGKTMMRRAPREFRDEPYGWITIGLIGLATFFTIFLFMQLIVPTRHEALRGFRRAVKLGRSRVASFSDDNSSLGFAVALLVIGTCGWNLFSSSVFAAEPFSRVKVSNWQWIAQSVAICLPLLAFQLVLEWRGWRTALLLVLFLWVVPPLAAIIMAASGRLETLAFYTASVSGPLMPVFSVAQAAMEAHPPPHNIGPRVQGAFWFSVILYAIALPFLYMGWRRYRVRLQAITVT
ncbi:MAG: hypothetical protein ACI8T1_001482 [Verrucomicrobiales bacterium]|jgi:hypothetical protein